MNRFFWMFAVSFGLLFFAPSLACAQSPVYPQGIKSRSDIVNGIYAGTDAGNCCWIATHAQMRVVVPAGADTLLLNVYLPNFAVEGGANSLYVQIGGARPVRRCCLGAGEHELTIPLPRAARRGPLTIKLWPEHTFVPKLIGLNDDPRHLSMMLREVGFLNSVTGERLGAGPIPWLPARAAIPLLLAGGLAALLLTLRRPLYGLLALIATNPFLLAYSIHGTTVTLPKVTLIGVALGLAPRIGQIARTRPLRTLLVLGGAQLLFVVTMLPGSVHAIFHGAALRETLKAAEYLITIVVAYGAFRLDPGERAFRIAVALITIVVTALAFVQLGLPIGETELIAGHDVARIGGPLEGPNQLAGYLGVVVPVMLAFALLRRPLLLELLGLPMGIIACVMTFSRGGGAALLVAVVVMLTIRYFAAARVWVGSGAIALFAVVLALAFGVFSGALHGTVQALFGSTGAVAFNGGLGSRVDLWHGAYAFWRSHPLFGIGPGNFELEIGRFVPGARTHANGIYFQVLAEQGIVGLIAALVVTAASIGAFVRRLDEPLALGACMASVAMAFHQIVDCMWLYPKVAIMWWLVLASAAAVVDRRAQSAEGVQWS
ncbi:MAG TPA: O-antigen ligase family protein [Candidatus Baltobacteraceae bacterium]|nr:O-antigen ligase family protein [Candidatus Baltobacteraceae bacterium]